jgi:hypothetical protein
MLLGLVMVVTLVAYQQDTVTHKDSLPPATVPATAQVPAPAPPPTIEQIRFMDGLKTATRGIAQIKNGVDRVVRTQQAGDSLTRRRAARRLGGLCGTARSFIVSGRPKMQSTAYADTMRVLAKQLTVRLDSLNAALPVCEKTAGRDPNTVATTLTGRLKNYDDALLAFRTALKPDSTKAISQQ